MYQRIAINVSGARSNNVMNHLSWRYLARAMWRIAMSM